jgi:hypothetical protein
MRIAAVFQRNDSWTSILKQAGAWDHLRAAAVCTWTSYSLLSILSVLYPLKMLPLVMFEILYKIIWLIIVAYPLWAAHRLAGSPAEEMTIVAMP